MEDYKKKYFDAIERLKQWDKKNPNGYKLDDRDAFIFPELKESEDEEIRKGLLKLLNELLLLGGVASDEWDRKECEKYAAWLEKQDEQKPTLPIIWKYKKDHTPLLRDSLILNKYGSVAKSPSGALVSDVWVLDYDELAKLPKEEYDKQGEQKPVETKPHLPDGSIPYDRGFEEAQEFLSKRGFDVPWNDCDVYVDERHITQTVANVLTWADEHPKQKPEWSEEDRRMLIGLIDELDAIMNKATPNEISVYSKYTNWLKSLKDKVIPQQAEWSDELREEFERKYNEGKAVGIEMAKQEWSKEDENHLKDCLRIVNSTKKDQTVFGIELINECIDWLKSLKDRVLPQQKQEWSEEDKRALSDAIVALSMYAFGDIPNILPSQMLKDAERLKSLRPQSHWKPTEEQMNELKYAYIDKPYSSEVLETLYNDLKTL